MVLMKSLIIYYTLILLRAWINIKVEQRDNKTFFINYAGEQINEVLQPPADKLMGEKCIAINSNGIWEYLNCSMQLARFCVVDQCFSSNRDYSGHV